MARASSWLLDRADRYGGLSRLLHWGMALLFAWQFTGMALRLILGRTPLTAIMVGSHAPVGLTLCTLAVLRLAWAWRQRRRRPAYAADWSGRLARLGHAALYTLMIVVPTLALLRNYGAGRPLRLFGLQIMEKADRRIAWMIEPANLLHGVLAWTLLALVAGHVARALAHHWWWRDDTLRRMAGRRRSE